ncbi:hypothetical protein ACFQU2_24120 [Siccirubricoccus deserti]
MMMSIRRRAMLAATGAALAGPALGQGRFPNRPIRFLIPWPPAAAWMRCTGPCSRS